MDFSVGWMVIDMKGSLNKTIYKDVVDIYGWMEDSTKGFGKIIK
jgi:hypothetical protein